MFSILLDQNIMGYKTLLILRVSLWIALLSMTTTGCSTLTTGGDIVGLKVTQSYTGSDPQKASLVPPFNGTPVANPTFLGTEDAQNPEGNVFYVSLAGNNSDGRSWETAWNEIDQIQWDEVRPGDTIVIGGGEYHTGMEVEKSGTLGMPITITTNGEQVVLDGQRPALPYCGQTDYIPEMGGIAIDLDGQSFIVIDGQDWRGIEIRNHFRGIRMQELASNIIVRNVEIHDIGYSRGSGSGTAPNGAGVRLGGHDILFERVIIHDNGQDAFQAGFGVWNFTLRNSWLYNSLEHPIEPGKSFNYCSHTDGIQIYGGGQQGPVLVEDSIIGPSFTQGIIIGSKATVDDVVIRNTLFVGSDNAGIIISDGGQSSNWILQNLTIVQDECNRCWNLKMNGSGHRIGDSIFWGGPWGIGIFSWSDAIGNINWLTPDTYNVAVEVDPIFVDGDYSKFRGEDFADFDFTIQNSAIPPGTGSSITSVSELIDQTNVEIQR